MEEPKPITVTFRSAMPSDYQLCTHLDHSISTDYVWQMILDSHEDQQGVMFRVARLPRSMKVVYPRSDTVLLASWQTHSIFLVAEWEKEVIGYVNIRLEEALYAAWIADLVVDSGYRLQGIGTGLLNAARQWAVEHDLRRMIVETQTKNYPGIRFLQKRGLTFCGYNELFYPNQDIAVFFGQTLR